MKAFVITLKDNQYSNEVADRCIQSAVKVGLTVEKFYGIDRNQAEYFMRDEGLEWTWANNNTKENICEKTNLKQHPYMNTRGKFAPLDAKIGCSMSHYLLWKKCIKLDEPILILEHDSVFLLPLPDDIDFNGICQINNPMGATRRSGQWYKAMVKRGTRGVHPKTMVTTEADRNMPDGLAGNSAYMIKPWAAQELVDKFHELGVWPNDATMCQQLFPYLEEYYPFITKVIQGKSTTTI